MKTYPIFAIIDQKPCLVVGGGAVGERKVQDLCAVGARVTVVSPTLTPRLAAMAAAGEIRHLPADFSPEQVAGMALVMAATDDPEVNGRVSAAARSRDIWVNVADAPELCTFIVPAQVRRGELTLAISTGGASPALARRLRQELEQLFGPEYATYLRLLKEIRTALLTAQRAHPDNARLFSRLVASPLKDAVARRDPGGVVDLLTDILGPALSRETLLELVNQAFAKLED
jgi:precorrin-2 dehydrogenase / sirohydrochlorin ferrochelatase